MADKRYGVSEAARDILRIANPKLRALQLGVDVASNAAKVPRGLQIAQEVYDKWAERAEAADASRNENYDDAMRHAEWMSRTADDLQLGRWTPPRRMPGALGHYMKQENRPPSLQRRMQKAEARAEQGRGSR